MSFLSTDLFCCTNSSTKDQKISLEVWDSSIPHQSPSLLGSHLLSSATLDSSTLVCADKTIESRLESSFAQIIVATDNKLELYHFNYGNHEIQKAEWSFTVTASSHNHHNHNNANTTANHDSTSSEKPAASQTHFSKSQLEFDQWSVITHLETIPNSNLMIVVGTDFVEYSIILIDCSRIAQPQDSSTNTPSYIMHKFNLKEPVKKLEVVNDDKSSFVLIMSKYGHLSSFALRERHKCWSLAESFYHPAYKSLQHLPEDHIVYESHSDTIVDFCVLTKWDIERSDNSVSSTEIIIQPEFGTCYSFDVKSNEPKRIFTFDFSADGFGHLGKSRGLYYHLGGFSLNSLLIRSFDITSFSERKPDAISIDTGVKNDEIESLTGYPDSFFVILKSTSGQCFAVDLSRSMFFSLSDRVSTAPTKSSKTVNGSFHKLQQKQKTIGSMAKLSHLSNDHSINESSAGLDAPSSEAVQEMMKNPEVKKWTEKVDEIYRKNEALPDEHRLKFDEIIINTKYQTALIASTKKKIEKLELEQQKKISDTFAEIKSFRAKFYENLDVPLSRLVSIDDEAVYVENYKLRNRKRSRKLFEKLILKRQVDMDAVKNQEPVNTINSKPQQITKSTQSSTLSVASQHYLLDIDAINSKWKKSEQIFILQECIYEAKEHFNSLFNESLQNRNSEVQRFQDRNQKIVSFAKELDVDATPWLTQIVHDCSANTLFGAAETAENEEKEKANKKKEVTGQYKRNQEFVDAVHEMMGDSYDDKAAKTIAPPACLSKPENQLNNDEKQIIASYKARLVEMENERQKRKGFLNEELKRLSIESKDASVKFSKKIVELQQKKIETDIIVYKMMVEKCLLAQNVQIGRQLESKESNFIQRLQVIKRDKDDLTSDIPKIKQELDRLRSEYEIFVRSSVKMDKIFKSKTYYGTSMLVDLYDKIKSADLADLEQFKMEELVKPDSISDHEWKDFQDLLSHMLVWAKQKVKQYAVFLKAQDLANSILQLSERLKSEAESHVNNLNNIRVQLQDNDNNSPFMLYLQFKQHECGDVPSLSDYNQCFLINQVKVDELNEKLKSLNGKCHKSIKDCLKQQQLVLYHIWEKWITEFKIEEANISLKETHAYKLEDHIMDFLKHGNQKNKKKDMEIQALEARLGQISKNNDRKLALQKRQLTDLQKEINTKKKINNGLQTDIDKLKVEIQNLESKVSTFDPMVLREDEKKAGMEKSFMLRSKLRESEAVLEELIHLLEIEKKRTFPQFENNSQSRKSSGGVWTIFGEQLNPVETRERNIPK